MAASLQSVSDCHANSGVGMSTNVNLGFYFVHCEMIVCFMSYFFLPILRRIPRPGSARPAPPRVKRQESTETLVGDR